MTVEEVQDGFILFLPTRDAVLVEKRLLVPESAGAYEDGRVMRKAARSFGRTIISVVRCCAPSPLNETFTVLADLGDCYYVEIDGTAGFITRDSVSSKFIVVYHGGGGSSGGADGGDITLGYEKKTLPTVVALADTDEPELQPGDRARVLKCRGRS